MAQLGTILSTTDVSPIGSPRTATLVVAASNSSASFQASADYVCDGTADDVEINAALTALGDDGLLQLSEGDFYCAATVRVKNHSVWIRGMGNGNQINAASQISMGTRLRPVTGFTGTEVIGCYPTANDRPVYACKLSDFTVDGNLIAGPIDGIYFRSNRGQMFNVHVHRCTGHGLRMRGYLLVDTPPGISDFDLYDTSVIACQFYTNTLNGIDLRSGATDLHFGHCICGSNGQDNLYMENCASQQIQSCHFYHGGRYNIHLYGGGTRTKFSNCKIENSNQHNVVLDSTLTGITDVQFIGCNFHSSAFLAATNTYSHIHAKRASGTGRFDRLLVVGCIFGYYSATSLLMKYGIEFTIGGVVDVIIASNNFIPGHFGTAPASLGAVSGGKVGANNGYVTENGALYNATPGAVSSIAIPHLLSVTPTSTNVTPANTNARGAPSFYVTVDATNLTLNFSSALTAATVYQWYWSCGKGES